MKVRSLILGAGIAGLACANELDQDDAYIFEQNETYGGLCHSFQLDGFTFDSAVHLSFTEDELVRKQFDRIPHISHLPLAYNFYKGHWIKHPVINNLFPLSPEEKTYLLEEFVNREENKPVNNYRDWLYASYGKGFSETFYEVYTSKYWTVDAEKLSTTWIGKRLGSADIRKILWGAFSPETVIDYYAKEMRYPITGGYQAFIDKLSKNVNIAYRKRAVEVDLDSKKVSFQDGTVCYYDNLISSVPLPELAKITKGLPKEIRIDATCLKASKISLVSIGFYRENIPKSLWFYIYDKDIMAARVNSPSMKSENNVPPGCSSLQFEIYHAPDAAIEKEEIIENTKMALRKMNLCEEKDIALLDYRLLEYGNVIFENNMESKRDRVKTYYKNKGVTLIGRFGEWEYYWSDQSYISGKRQGEEIKLRQEKKE